MFWLPCQVKEGLRPVSPAVSSHDVQCYTVRGLVIKVTGTPLLFPGGTRPASALQTRSFGLTHLVEWPGDMALARGPLLSQQLGVGPAEWECSCCIKYFSHLLI